MGFWHKTLTVALFLSAAARIDAATAQTRPDIAANGSDTTADDEEDTGTGYDDYKSPEPLLSLATREDRAKAIRALKKVERRSKNLGVLLNYGKMEKMKGDRLFKVLSEYERFISILEEMPENFVKACKIGTVWFSDEIADFSGSHAGGFASAEGINMSMNFGRGTVYHEMFHKFERCITDRQKREWEELNPKDFIYEGSSWDTFAGNDKYSKRTAERHQKRIASGKAKSAKDKLEESRRAKDKKRIEANRNNPEVQGAFINSYAQTTPLEDRACVFGCMVEEGPLFLKRAAGNEHMRRKMEFMIELTGTKKFLGKDFWNVRVEPSRINEEDARYGRIDISNWPKATPADMGLKQAYIDAIPRLLARRNMDTSAIVVVVGGKVIYEYGDSSTPCDISLCWTSLMSMLFGRHVHAQTINLDETLKSIGLDDVGGLSDRERMATVRHLLASRSGCRHKVADVKHKVSKESSAKIPGSVFEYNTWNFNAAASIFEMKTGKNVITAFDEEIAVPLGFQDWDSSMQEQNGDTRVSSHLACKMRLSARDMARGGELMLRKGMWRGMRILPKRWVEESTSLTTKLPDGEGFGYSWWVENENQQPNVFKGAFSARGANGQRITVIPKLDMVVVYVPSMTSPTRREDFRLLLQLIAMARGT